MKTFKWQCPYCDKKYKLQKWVDQHTCKEKERSEEIKTFHGQRAFEYYRMWNSANHRKTHALEHFITSSYYTSFINLSKFVKRVAMPAPETYIKLMVERNMQPNMWVNDHSYKYYMEYIDRRMSPKDQAAISIKTIERVCAMMEVETDKFFDEVDAGAFIQFVIQRRLSPWIMYNSPKCRAFMQNEMSDTQRAIVTNICPPHDWKRTFNKRPKDVKYMKDVISVLEI